MMFFDRWQSAVRTKRMYDLEEREKGEWGEDEVENDATSRREISFLRSIYDPRTENIPVYI